MSQLPGGGGGGGGTECQSTLGQRKSKIVRPEVGWKFQGGGGTQRKARKKAKTGEQIRWQYVKALDGVWTRSVRSGTGKAVGAEGAAGPWVHFHLKIQVAHGTVCTQGQGDTTIGEAAFSAMKIGGGRRRKKALYREKKKKKSRKLKLDSVARNLIPQKETYCLRYLVK